MILDTNELGHLFSLDQAVTLQTFSTTAARKETFTIQDEEDFQKKVLQNPGN